MFGYKFAVLCVLLSVSENCLGRQNYATNTDFLAHETGSTGPKRDYVAPKLPDNNSNTQINQQQPTLRPQSSTSVHTTTKPNAQSNINNKPQQSSGKRDYVAPKLPEYNRNTQINQQLFTLNPQSSSSVHTTTKPNTQSNVNNKPQQSTGRRDYVAPQMTQKPTSIPHNSNGGKVQDLINFYDNKNTNNNGQSVPSYSSILRGNNNRPTTATLPTMKQPVNPSGQNVPTVPTPKPLSFSAVVAGSNKQSTPAASIQTQRPSTRLPTYPQSQTTLPGTPVLPSSLLNQNKNNNNNNQNNNANGPTDIELQTLSEELLKKDTNNAAKYLTINYQDKTTSQSTNDNALQPLLTVSSEVWNIPTVQTFVPLLDNYVRDTLVNEYVTPMERTEENNFMDAIMSTSVIRHLMTFLLNKGYVTPDPRQQREYLKQMWFGLYSRGKGKLSSSGFEHIFVSELRNSEVLGLHNWIYFAKEESQNRVNYLGYLKYSELGNKGAVLKLHFNQDGSDKPVDTMFIGTSPELEIALYTLCFVIRADKDCKLKLESKDVDIVTHTFRYRSKNYIGSAYPQI